MVTWSLTRKYYSSDVTNKGSQSENSINLHIILHLHEQKSSAIKTTQIKDHDNIKTIFLSFQMEVLLAELYSLPWIAADDDNDDEDDNAGGEYDGSKIPI